MTERATRDPALPLSDDTNPDIVVGRLPTIADGAVVEMEMTVDMLVHPESYGRAVREFVAFLGWVEEMETVTKPRYTVDYRRGRRGQ